jgi:hypothetical protein
VRLIENKRSWRLFLRWHRRAGSFVMVNCRRERRNPSPPEVETQLRPGLVDSLAHGISDNLHHKALVAQAVAAHMGRITGTEIIGVGNQYKSGETYLRFRS